MLFIEVLASDDVAAATVYDHKGTVGAVGFWTTVPGQSYTIEIRQGEFGKVLSVEGQMNCWHGARQREWLATVPGGNMFFPFRDPPIILIILYVYPNL